MRTLVKKILEFDENMSKKQRSKIMTAATAFAASVYKLSNTYQTKNNVKIGLPFKQEEYPEINALASYDGSFSLSERLYKSNETICADLMSVFHEVSHVLNDDANNAKKKNITTSNYEILWKGQFLDCSKDDFEFLEDYTKRQQEIAEGKEVFISQEEHSRCANLWGKHNYIESIIFRAYATQPHEVRARAWEEKTMEEFIRLAQDEREWGKLSEKQKIKLGQIEAQYKDILEERRECSVSFRPLTSAEMTVFKQIVTDSMYRYAEIIPSYIKKNKLLQGKMREQMKIVDPIKYVTKTLELYYDDEIAHLLFNSLTNNININPEEYSDRLLDICVHTPIKLTEEEQAVFEDFYGKAGWNMLENMRRDSEKIEMFQIFDPEKTDDVVRNTRLYNMPNKTLSEAMKFTLE